MTSTKLRLALAALAAGASLVACGSSPDGTTAPADTATAQTATATTGAGQTGKVSANTASEGEISAALQAAGVDNADRWAREVVEYRPYQADDAGLTSLRENLAKYNPGEDTVNKIVSALTP